MNAIEADTIYRHFPVSSERTLPVLPYPRTYIHCVFSDLRHVVQAVLALRIAGYNPDDIHVMASWDFVEAVVQKYERQNYLTSVCSRLYSFLDEGLGTVYLREAQRGKHILAVRLDRKEQMKQVRDILATQHASLMKYVDTWTVADLLPPTTRES